MIARRRADAPQLAQQPLTGLGGGETIREIHQNTPFSMVALTAEDLTGTSARVRAKKPDGTWGPWYEAEALEGVGPEAPAASAHTAPNRSSSAAPPRFRSPSPVRPAPRRRGRRRPTGAPGLGYLPANVEQPFAQNINAVLISPPQAPVDTLPLPSAVTAPGVPPNIINRAQWGADESMRCGNPAVRQRQFGPASCTTPPAATSTHPQDSAGIVRSIYEYHTRTLGWCDIAYNALVDKYGQVFEGRAGGMDQARGGSAHRRLQPRHVGRGDARQFRRGSADADSVAHHGRLLGWRLGMDRIDPRGTVVLASAGGSFSKFPFGATPTLPTIFTHRDVGITDCPGNAAYAVMDQIRDIAARFNDPPGPADLAETLRGGAIFARWESMGAMTSHLGGPTSPEASGEGPARYVTFERGAVYWSPASGAEPITGEIYRAWGSLGFERGALGLPTSGEIQEPQWIVQNFQHGTLNFDREKGTVTRVIDGVPLELPKPSADNAPIQLERFTPPISPA